MIFNHDGFGLLAELPGTDCTPDAADRVLVAPLAAAGFTEKLRGHDGYYGVTGNIRMLSRLRYEVA